MDTHILFVEVDNSFFKGNIFGLISFSEFLENLSSEKKEIKLVFSYNNKMQDVLEKTKYACLDLLFFIELMCMSGKMTDKHMYVKNKYTMSHSCHIQKLFTAVLDANSAPCWSHSAQLSGAYTCAHWAS